MKTIIQKIDLAPGTQHVRMTRIVSRFNADTQVLNELFDVLYSLRTISNGFQTVHFVNLIKENLGPLDESVL